ncbi:unnamed protein product [Amoebophrya sp. A25]|nr:unnamed protein product [Amoebophrya sp. A25]|eukprot:GSA25T00019747001.1
MVYMARGATPPSAAAGPSSSASSREQMFYSTQPITDFLYYPKRTTWDTASGLTPSAPSSAGKSTRKENRTPREPTALQCSPARDEDAGHHVSLDVVDNRGDALVGKQGRGGRSIQPPRIDLQWLLRGVTASSSGKKKEEEEQRPVLGSPNDVPLPDDPPRVSLTSWLLKDPTITSPPPRRSRASTGLRNTWAPGANNFYQTRPAGGGSMYYDKRTTVGGSMKFVFEASSATTQDQAQQGRDTTGETTTKTVDVHHSTQQQFRNYRTAQAAEGEQAVSQQQLQGATPPTRLRLHSDDGMRTVSVEIHTGEENEDLQETRLVQDRSEEQEDHPGDSHSLTQTTVGQRTVIVEPSSGGSVVQPVVDVGTGTYFVKRSASGGYLREQKNNSNTRPSATSTSSPLGGGPPVRFSTTSSRRTTVNSSTLKDYAGGGRERAATSLNNWVRPGANIKSNATPSPPGKVPSPGTLNLVGTKIGGIFKRKATSSTTTTPSPPSRQMQGNPSAGSVSGGSRPAHQSSTVVQVLASPEQSPGGASFVLPKFAQLFQTMGRGVLRKTRGRSASEILGVGGRGLPPSSGGGVTTTSTHRNLENLNNNLSPSSISGVPPPPNLENLNNNLSPSIRKLGEGTGLQFALSGAAPAPNPFVTTTLSPAPRHTTDVLFGTNNISRITVTSTTTAAGAESSASTQPGRISEQHEQVEAVPSAHEGKSFYCGRASAVSSSSTRNKPEQAPQGEQQYKQSLYTTTPEKRVSSRFSNLSPYPYKYDFGRYQDGHPPTTTDVDVGYHAAAGGTSAGSQSHPELGHKHMSLYTSSPPKHMHMIPSGSSALPRMSDVSTTPGHNSCTTTRTLLGFHQRNSTSTSPPNSSAIAGRPLVDSSPYDEEMEKMSRSGPTRFDCSPKTSPKQGLGDAAGLILGPGGGDLGGSEEKRFSLSGRKTTTTSSGCMIPPPPAASTSSSTPTTKQGVNLINNGGGTDQHLPCPRKSNILQGRSPRVHQTAASAEVARNLEELNSMPTGMVISPVSRLSRKKVERED